MKRLPEIILVLILFATSCVKPTHTYKQVEFLKLGYAEVLDTNNRYKLGATRYFSFTENSDSVLIKSYDLVNPQTGEAMYPMTPVYRKELISQYLKDNLDSIIDYVKPLPNGQLPDNKKPEEWIGCDLFGMWILIVTDHSNIKHYYIFGSYHLKDPIRVLCETYMENQDKANLHTRQDLPSINTDSLTEYCSTSFLKTDLADILPPPLKSTVKFTPPSIEEN